MMLHTKYQGSMRCGFRKEDFSCLPYISLCKTFDPRGEKWPQGYNLNKLGKGPLGDATVHTKHQGSRPCSYRQEDFYTISLYKPTCM